MCPASYTNTYKYRIYNAHERAASSSFSAISQSAAPKTMSLDRRNLDMYRSFSKPQRQREQHAGHSLFYRSLVSENHLKPCSGTLFTVLDSPVQSLRQHFPLSRSFEGKIETFARSATQ